MHKIGAIGKMRVSAFLPCAAPYIFHFIFSSLQQFQDHVLRKKRFVLMHENKIIVKRRVSAFQQCAATYVQLLISFDNALLPQILVARSNSRNVSVIFNLKFSTCFHIFSRKEHL